jgi:hypothetical protein
MHERIADGGRGLSGMPGAAAVASSAAGAGGEATSGTGMARGPGTNGL